MWCSGCGGSLQPGRFLTIPIDSCGGCGGTWLEEGRLKWILEVGPKSLPAATTREATRFKPREGRGGSALAPDEVRRIVKCPYCVGVMRPVNYSATSGVAIYRCVSDHGVWVPKGGLDRLVIFVDTWDRYLKAAAPYYSRLAQLERKRFLRRVEF
jgi:Zn-finger nucleic acid-binding protein